MLRGQEDAAREDIQDEKGGGGKASSPRPGAVRGGLLFMEVRSWLTGRRGVSVAFSDLAPPLCPDRASFDRFWEQAVREGTRRGWKYLEIRGIPSEWTDLPTSVSYHRHVLDLTVGEDALFRGLDRGLRRNVRKAEKAGVTVETARSLAAVREYYRIHCLTRKRQGSPPQPWRFFERIGTDVVEKGHGLVALAWHQGQAIAGALYLHTSTDIVYKFGGFDMAFNALRPSHLLHWTMIRDSARSGFRTMDFGRTSLDDDGLRRFKLELGTTEMPLRYVRYDLRRRQVVEVKDRANGPINRVFRLLPMPLLRLAGQLLYPHLS